jgi:hypothetical protein
MKGLVKRAFFINLKTNKMKKIIMLMAMPLLFACTSEDVQEEVKAKDCNCNRVVEVLSMNIVSAGSNVGVTKMYRYTTINDCTGVQRDSSWGYDAVTKGQCK